MIFSILIPLFISWLFKKAGLKKLFFTYIISGSVIILLPISIFVIRLINTGIIDASSLATDKSSIVGFLGNIGFSLFFTLFFQFIFNKTFKLKGSENK